MTDSVSPRLDVASLVSQLRLRSTAVWDAGDLVSAILSSSPAARERAARRLSVLAPLAIADAIGISEVDAAAKALGMGRRNLYRLVDLLRTGDPLAALGVRSPRPAVRKAEGVRPFHRDDVERRAEIVEKSIVDLLRREPDARLEDHVIAVAQACVAEGLPPPARLTVSRRLASLRRAMARGRVGRSVLVDQCGVSALVEDAGLLVPAVICVAIDVDALVIVGAGVGASPRSSYLAMSGDLKSGATRMRTRRRVADNLERLEIVVPDGMQMDPFANRAGVELQLRAEGARRYGVALKRLVGNRLGVLRLLPRITEEGARAARADGAESGQAVAMEDLRDLLRWEVFNWNDGLIGYRPDPVGADEPDDALTQLGYVVGLMREGI